MKVRIWSHEHNAYWRPNSRGYTTDGRQAGEYELSEAEVICLGANSHNPRYMPFESIVPIPEVAGDVEEVKHDLTLEDCERICRGEVVTKVAKREEKT